MKQLIYIFGLVALLPYVSFIPFPMDTAPFALLFLSALLLLLPLQVKYQAHGTIALKRVDLLPLGLLAFFVTVLVVRLIAFRDLDSFRVLGNYMSLFLFLLYFSAIASGQTSTQREFYRALSTLLVAASVVYLLGTLLQLASRLTGASILFEVTNMFLSADITGRTTSERGFNSFAAEPSYAGIVCSLLITIAAHFYRIGCLTKKRFLFSVTNYFVVVLLSAAATAVPFLIVAILAVAAAFGARIKFTVILMAGLMAAVLVRVAQDFEHIRFFYLLNLVASTGFTGLQGDVSTLSRLASPVNYVLPLLRGENLLGQALSDVSVGYFLAQIDELRVSPVIRASLEIGVTAEGGGLRTKSAIGQSLLLFGIPAVLFWLSLAVRFLYRRGLSDGRVFIIVVVVLGYIIQVPLGHPTFCLAIGLLLFRPSATSKGAAPVSAGGPAAAAVEPVRPAPA